LPKSTEARAKMKTLGPEQFEPSVEAAKEQVFARIQDGDMRVPTLIHWGNNDRSAPLDPDALTVFKLLSDNAPRISLHVENQAGHFAFKEKSKEFNQVVTGFFGALG
jgi:2-hydroxy-6-oxo-octa-2,4-dienoate hydrolase